MTEPFTQFDEQIRVKQWSNGEDRAYLITYTNHGYRTGGWHCGYVMFPNCPLAEEGYNNPQAYDVRVHGGITYAARDGDTDRYIYGFDCAHSGDEWNDDLSDIDWLTAECERLGAEIERVSQLDPSQLDPDSPPRMLAQTLADLIDLPRRLGEI